jgi:DNA mismatch endonuclease (patch repair protein)
MRGALSLEDQFHTNKAYWIAKIRRTIERDEVNTARLEALGWIVLRLWESEVIADSQACLGRVRAALLSSPKLSTVRTLRTLPGTEA